MQAKVAEILSWEWLCFTLYCFPWTNVYYAVNFKGLIGIQQNSNYELLPAELMPAPLQSVVRNPIVD